MDGLLFIDDEEGIRRSIARALQHEPFDTYTVGDGEAGIAFMRTHRDRIATVICDYRMPGLDGLTTLRRIGSLNPEATRIILTGYATMEAAIEATNEGIDGFLTKPFDNRELRAKIHEIGVRKRLRLFVPEPVVRQIERAVGALTPTVHEATILFVDIRGFTPLAQRVNARALAEYLNRCYFTPMGEIAYRHQGMVDKHIGDGIMVVFGVPVPRPDDALRAVRAAVAMQAAARTIDQRLARTDGLHLKVGIGICTGDVVAGILGSRRKKEFTCVGMPVNIAARLQQLAGAGQILVSRATVERLQGRIPSRAMAPARVKGIAEPIAVYRVDPAAKAAADTATTRAASPAGAPP